MLKKIPFAFLCFFFVSAQNDTCKDIFVAFKNTYPDCYFRECPFELKSKLKLFNESCDFLPSFPKDEHRHNDFYWIYAYNGSTCVEFVKDCCGKNFTSNDSCELVPHLPGITYQLVVELKVELKLDPYCRLSLSEEKEEFNDINIDRLHKYCHFEVDPEYVATKDLNVFVEDVPEFEYRKPKAESQKPNGAGLSCTDPDSNQIKPIPFVIVKNSEKIFCTDIQTSDSTHEFLKKEMAEANDTTQCAYVYSMKKFNCLLPAHIAQDTNFLAYILLPLISMFIIALILVYCCFRQSLQNIMKSILCQDDISNEKIGKILKIGSDDVGVATVLIPNVSEEKPDKIFSGTVLLIQRTAPAADNNESRNIHHSNGLEGEEDDDSHVSEHDSYLDKVQDLTKFSGSSAADSGITSEGGRGSLVSSYSTNEDGKFTSEGGRGSVVSSYSTNEDGKFKDCKKIATLDNISDCCFEEDEIVVHDEYTNNLDMICDSHKQQRQSASSVDTGCETSNSTDVEEEVDYCSKNLERC